MCSRFIKGVIMVRVDMRTVTIYCTCDSEALRVAPETEDDNINTCISIWERGCGDRKSGFKWKWFLIKHILKHGTAFGDQIIINETGRRLLIQALQAYDTEESDITFTNTDTSVSEGIDFL